MPKTMRLIDACPVEEEVIRLRGAAEGKGDKRAAAALGYVLDLLRDAPMIPIRPDEDKMKRKKYGKYKNVLLSDAEIETWREESPDDWKEWIEEVSEGIAKSGKKYKNFLAVLRSWKRRRDREKAEHTEPVSSFDTDDVFAAAMNRTYGDVKPKGEEDQNG